MPNGSGLDERLKIPGYSDVLDLVVREGGAKKLRSLWDTRDFSKDINARVYEACPAICGSTLSVSRANDRRLRGAAIK